MKEKQADPIKTFRAQWAVMTFYERFEQVIALALSAIIAVIIVVSLLQLISIVFSLLITWLSCNFESAWRVISEEAPIWRMPGAPCHPLCLDPDNLSVHRRRRYHADYPAGL